MLKEMFRGFFSLTGAAFNCSSYQHPRRDLGINSNLTEAGLVLLV